tara:strand:+ start:851 stop:964 length:114 start_codon:yes stop_codon:yes gene_type:complete
MNKKQQQMYKDISDIAKALIKLVKILEKQLKHERENY